MDPTIVPHAATEKVDDVIAPEDWTDADETMSDEKLSELIKTIVKDHEKLKSTKSKVKLFEKQHKMDKEKLNYAFTKRKFESVDFGSELKIQQKRKVRKPSLNKKQFVDFLKEHDTQDLNLMGKLQDMMDKLPTKSVVELSFLKQKGGGGGKEEVNSSS